MKNRRGFNPDARIKDADFAFRVLSDSVFTKGFLGPSLSENRGLPSVGVSSARRAGVIVDDNGKMRCPPGTPNANQFTDINMSNCMIPSAETVAQEAADAAKEMARFAADGFKRGSNTDKVKADGVAPIANLGFRDEDGFSVQKFIPTGVAVVSPKDGTERRLLSLDDSVQHIADGGNLNEIPDEHLVDAIKRNTGIDFYRGGNKRFQQIGSGGGVNGMLRYEDTVTGALIGVKYENGRGSVLQDEPLNEALSEVVSMHFGYQPMPMRLTYNSVVKDENTGVSYNNGQAIVSELAHNRYAGSISGASVVDGKDPVTISTEDLARMALLDSVLANPDRHEANMLFAVDDAGRDATLVPIDQSLGFQPGAPSSEDQMQFWVKSAGAVCAIRLDLQAEKHNTIEGRKKMAEDVAKIQEELRAINIEQLRAQLEDVLTHHTSRLYGNTSPGRRESIDQAIQRLEVIRDANAERLVELMMARYPDPNKPVKLEDFADPLGFGW